MANRISVNVVSSGLVLTAMVLPSTAATANQVDEGLDAKTQPGRTSLPVVDGLSAAQVADAQQYLLDNGLPVEEIEGFAAQLEISVPDLYRFVTIEIDRTGGGRVQTPVEMVDGKVRYNNTVVGDLPALASSTDTQQGRAVDGSCSFPMIAADTTLGEHVLSEVTELDPEACVRTITSVAYDPERWNDPGPQTNIAQDSFIPGLSCKDGGWPDTQPPTFFQPPRQWAPTEHRRYYKQAFVDPICISVTSSSINASWKNQVNSPNGVTLIDRDARTYYFEQLGEQWVNKTVTLNPGVQPLNRANEIYATLEHHRRETDFPEHLQDAAAAFGAGIPGIGIIAGQAAVWAACNFNLDDTDFGSWQQLELRRDGNWNAGGWGNVTGGCSNLVHEQVWHGAGAYAR